MNCFNPYPANVKNKDGGYRFYGFVPCGSCLACKIQKSSEWATRLTHEYSIRKKGVFLTLTYSDDFLPEDKSLHKKHLQDFHKRLRQRLVARTVRHMRKSSKFEGLSVTDMRKLASKKLSGKLKFFACGEYGDKNGRPHYHDIILGFDKYDKHFVEAVKKSWTFCDWKKLKFDDVFGSVSYDSCRYVADYSFSKKNRKQLVKEGYLERLETKDEFGNDKVVYKVIKQPPFQLVSQGIGLSFVEKYKDELLQSETVRVNGVERSLPRYYKNKLNIPKSVTSLTVDKGKLQIYDTYISNHKQEYEDYSIRYSSIIRKLSQENNEFFDYFVKRAFYNYHMFKTRKQTERNKLSNIAIHKSRQSL